MNISKALKLKNRLIGELNRLQEIARRENARREDSTSNIDCKEIFQKMMQTRQNLVLLKGSINRASAGISNELVALAEIKQYINWLQSLPIRTGIEYVNMGSNTPPKELKWTSTVNREQLDQLIQIHQQEAESLQDRIDEYNAKTQIDAVNENATPAPANQKDTENSE